MNYVAIFHANLNYAYLVPEKYEFVIRSSYELILDTMKEQFPDTPFVFEASGYTVDQIAEKAPDVLAKLRDAIGRGQCEFMGSPYAHPMLPNFPQEDGLWSIRFSNEAYQRHLAIRPRSFWNPECGWRSYVPELVVEAGYANLIGDFEAYSRSRDSDGRPLRPEIYEKEHTDEPVFYSFGFNYDLPGAERAIHFPFRQVAGVPGGQLRVFLRTDRVAQFGVRFFMGMPGYTLAEYLALIRRYSQQPAGETEGALVIFADDAEYIGTNGWFRLKYENKPDNVFELATDAKENLVRLVRACLEMGRFVTFDWACNRLPALPEAVAFDDDSAWHGAAASTWADTPMARLLRPWQDLVRAKLAAQSAAMDRAALRAAWFHLTNSYNSDGQWPPTLPNAPHIIHPFNYGYCFRNLLAAELLVGGVDRGMLAVDAAATLCEILGPQQALVLKKAQEMIASIEPVTAEAGRLARFLVEKSRHDQGVARSGAKVLYPAEYEARADMLVAARRLVGGIEIEKLKA